MTEYVPEKKSNKGLIIAIVVIALLLCCCCAALLIIGWFYGDQILEALQAAIWLVSPLFLA